MKGTRRILRTLLSAGLALGPAGAGQDSPSEVLKAARATSDLRPALALYERLLTDHPKEVSRCKSAATDRLRRLLAAPPEETSRMEIGYAALSAARWSRRFVKEYGNPSSHVILLLDQSYRLLERYPLAALGLADRGEDYVHAMAPHTEEFTVEGARYFGPLRLMALRALGRWDDAGATLEAAVGSFEELFEVPISPRVRVDADRARLAAAAVLEELDRTPEARELLWFLAETSPDLASDYARFRDAHPLEPSGEEELHARLALRLEAAREQAVRQRRTAILDSLEDSPFPEMILTDMLGAPRTIGDGLVIVTVWASWCVPCHWQLEDLVPLELPAGSSVLAISVDEDLETAAAHSQELTQDFDFAHASGQERSDLGAATGIPKLFVLQSGRIRYRRVGHDRGTGQRLREELGWVLDAIEP